MEQNFSQRYCRLSGDTGLIRVLKIEQIAGDRWINIHDKYSNARFVNKAFVDIVAKSPQDITWRTFEEICGFW